MSRLFVMLVIFCVFSAEIVKGFDKSAILEDLKAKVEECKEEVGATDSDVEEIIHKMPASTPEAKCLRSCVLQKYEMMDDSGNFMKDAAVAHFQQFMGDSDEKMQIFNDMIDKCTAVETTGDPCEAAEEFVTCFKEEAMAHSMKH